ncbi:MAG: phenylalanine--tRNA ligase subunit beta [Eubacteriales bacterium]|nr:phenylalanine--tRNA ligase subunit beta [Eubacteriales bacterium]
MKVSLNWIKEYVDLPELTAEKLSYDLTMRTVEVEGAENPKDSFDKIVAGRIIEVAPHPDADKLRVCQVDVGEDEPSQIVCGGTNLYEGQYVAVARPGSYVVWHGEGEPVKIKSSKLRGVKSEGMICASDELKLGDLFPTEHEGIIMDLKDFDCKPGDNLADVLGLDDLILEIDNKSMTNRPDLWGHYGLARELAAIYGVPLKEIPAFEAPKAIDKFPISIESENCYRYAGLMFDGVKNRPAPYDMQKKLFLCGLRPINALVDITNYLMLALGQPTHGFDARHVEKGIEVRQAQKGEKLTLLDKTALNLNEEDLLICSGRKPMALAGIMGGEEDSILADTDSILLEIATFNPTAIRRSASKYKIHTDSSLRNEKGLDTQRVDKTMGLAQKLIKDLFPESKITAMGDVATKPTEQNKILCNVAWLNTRLGRTLSIKEIEQSLLPLGFEVKEDGENLFVTAPSYRSTGDVSLPDDILEEIARMIGYENFEYQAPKVTLTGAVKAPRYNLERAICEYLAFRCGMQEIFTYPWVDDSLLKATGIEKENLLQISSPPTPENACLRPSLLPNMLQAVRDNLRYFENFSVFEMTQVFEPGEMHPSEEEETLPKQTMSLCAALVGNDAEKLLLKAKGILEGLPRICMAEKYSFEQREKPAWADKNAWLNIVFEDNIIGSFALLSPKTLKEADIKKASCVLFEINTDSLKPLASRDNRYEALPQYPQVEQDFSVLLGDTVLWERIVKALKRYVNDIAFVEEYRGAQVPEGKKSLLIRVWFGKEDGTLSPQEIDSKMAKIIKELSQKLGGEIRK